MSDFEIPTLRCATPDEGFALALHLARLGVKHTQPSAEVRSELRPAYDHDAGLLIEASHVVAVHFATVSAANAYWR